MRQLIAIALVFGLSGCGHIPTIARIVHDVTHLLCCAGETETAKELGVSVGDHCSRDDVRAAYEPEARAAIAASQKVGVSRVAD